MKIINFDQEMMMVVVVVVQQQQQNESMHQCLDSDLISQYQRIKHWP